MSFALSLTVGAAVLASWVDWRLDERRPQSLTWRIAHLAAAFVVLQATTLGFKEFAGDGAGVGQRLGILFVLFLPSLVYAFLTGLWLMRTLADVTRTARH